MKMVAGGDILKGRGDVYPNPLKPEKVRLRTDRVCKILGQSLGEEEISSLLESVEFVVNGSENLEVEVPTFRARDVAREIDLIEEVARLKGYDWIDSDYKCGVRVFGKIDPVGMTERKLREFFVGEGFFEVISTSFISTGIACSLMGIPESDLMLVDNPVNAEERFMRPLLLSTILQILANNVRKRNRDVRIFEFGNVFRTGSQPGGNHEEVMHLAFATAGSIEPLNWKDDVGAWDFHTFKGVVERFVQRYLSGARFTGNAPSFLNGQMSSSLIRDSKEIGFFGEVLPEVARTLEITGNFYVFEVDAGEISSYIEGTTQRGVSRFPPLERDLSLIVPEGVSYGEVEKIIRSESGNLLDELILFDLYRGGQIPEGRKGLSFRLMFRSKDRTLEDQEINCLIEATIESLRKELNVVLR
jgi:phenylalanyl-tRNA synthetase beta chain